jgi:serine/threonine-protein kinase
VKPAAALNHPNVAHIYEIGEVDGVHFIAISMSTGGLCEKNRRTTARIKEIVDGLQAADAWMKLMRKSRTGTSSPQHHDNPGNR